MHWIRRFILHHGKRHPGEMGGSEIEAFLTHLREGDVAQPAHRRKRLFGPSCSYTSTCCGRVSALQCSAQPSAPSDSLSYCRAMKSAVCWPRSQGRMAFTVSCTLDVSGSGSGFMECCRLTYAAGLISVAIVAIRLRAN